MSTALWIVFWVLATLLGSLIFSLLVAALIRVGNGGTNGDDVLRDRGPTGGAPERVDPPPELRPEHDGPDAG